MKENELQSQVLDYLKWKKYLVWRQNSGAFKRDNHFYRFASINGLPDIMCIIPPDGQLVGIECKAKYGKQSPAQIKFQEDLEDAGGRYILTYKLEDVKKII